MPKVKVQCNTQVKMVLELTERIYIKQMAL